MNNHKQPYELIPYTPNSNHNKKKKTHYFRTFTVILLSTMIGGFGLQVGMAVATPFASPLVDSYLEAQAKNTLPENKNHNTTSNNIQLTSNNSLNNASIVDIRNLI